MEKINRLIQKDLSEIIREKSREEFFSSVISVTRVDVTSDLSLARVYVSIFAPTNVLETVKDEKEKKNLTPSEYVLKLLREKKDLIRMYLGQRERHQLRIIPDITFYLDDTLDYAKRIDELLKQ